MIHRDDVVQWNHLIEQSRNDFAIVGDVRLRSRFGHEVDGSQDFQSQPVRIPHGGDVPRDRAIAE